MGLEEKTRKLTMLVKEKKDKGMSPRSSKLATNQQLTVTETAVNRTEADIQYLEEKTR